MFTVPPNPTTIFDGSVSRKFGMYAPSPTFSPLSPTATTATVAAWTATACHGIPSSTSLTRISTSATSTDPVAANANLPHRICSRLTGSQPEDPELPPFQADQRVDEPAQAGAHQHRRRRTGSSG